MDYYVCLDAWKTRNDRARSRGRYIERNPLEAGMVKAPWDYPWSSCRYYALGEPNALLAEDPCYAELSPDPNRRQILWREFLLGEDMREGAIRRQEWAIGDADFCRALAGITGRPLPPRRGRPPRGEGKTVRVST